VRTIFVCLTAVAIVSAAPAIAQDNSGAQGKAAVDVNSRLVDQYNEHMGARQFGDALADLKRVKLEDGNREGRGVLYAMTANALLGLKRDREARDAIAKADSIAPQLPAVANVTFYGGLLTARFDISAEALDKMFARYPDAVRDIDLDSMSFFLRNEPKGQDRQNDDRRVQLARIGYGGDLNGDYFASEAIDILLKRADPAAAGALLKHVDQPMMIENMLVQKRYSALWPRLVEVAGPHLSKVRASSVAAAERAYSEKPDDHDLLEGFANALRHAGRLDDAIALRAKLPTAADMPSADEKLGWAVNNVAISLHEAGRGDEADRLFALLNDAPIKDAGWRVSMIINRVEMLVNDGKFERAVPLLDATESSAKNDGSPYAQQLVRRLRFCTLAGLGRQSDAAKVRADLLAHAKDAYHATVDALLCAGDVDEAEKLTLTALRNTDEKMRSSFEEDFVRGLQPIPLTSDDPSKWQGRWAELRKRPAIAKEYERLGRDMPPEFLPPKPDAAVVK